MLVRGLRSPHLSVIIVAMGMQHLPLATLGTQMHPGLRGAANVKTATPTFM